MDVSMGTTKAWTKWDLDSGVCPYGHQISECASFRKGKYPYCRKHRYELLVEKNQRLTGPQRPEYRCPQCSWPLFAGYHVFDRECV